MRWAWDPVAKRYRDLDTGRFMPRTQMLEYVRQSLGASDIAGGQLAGYVSSGALSARDFGLLMREELKKEYIREYLLGRGGIGVMTPADWGSIGGMLSEQYKHLNEFVAEIAKGNLTPEQIAARTHMYINSAREAYEKAHERNAQDLGMDEEMWVLGEDIEDHCEDCPAFAAQGWQPLGTFPTPGDGETQCMCILTPWSMVTTRRGRVPMWDVRIGEDVLTHRGRYRPVTAIQVKPAAGAQLAYIIAPNGKRIGCTTDHLWHTQDGWIAACDIDNRLISWYPPTNGGTDHENMQEVWEDASSDKLVWDVQAVPVCVRVRTAKGLSGEALQELRGDTHRDGAMAEDTSEDVGRPSRRGAVAPDAPGGYCRTRQLATEKGWTLLDLVLGRGQKADDLPVPVNVDKCARAYSGGDGCAPQESRHERRQNGEPGIVAGRCSCAAARRNCAHEGAGQFAGLDVPTVREDISDVSARGATAQVLLAGMLDASAAVYDLQVAEDHSFVIEGLAAHNTNCACHKVFQNSKTGQAL